MAAKTQDESANEVKNDPLTVAAIGVIVYAMANVLHEGVGHGGACLLVGGKPLVLSSMHFDSDVSGLSGWGEKIIAAGGTLVNLLSAAIGFIVFRRARNASHHLRFFLWLFVTINLLQGTGYFMFSGIGNIGDWAAVIAELPGFWFWRAALAIIGGVSYWFSVNWAMTNLGPFIGGDSAMRYGRANVLCLISYFSGGALYIVSGLFNPEGFVMLFVSAVAASLGGTSGLAWGPQLLRGEGIPRFSSSLITVNRNWIWIASALVVTLIFVAVLGPGIRLD